VGVAGVRGSIMLGGDGLAVAYGLAGGRGPAVGIAPPPAAAKVAVR